jgi:plastocyanin
VIRHKRLLSIVACALLATSSLACGGDDDDGGITNVPDDCRDLAAAANIPQGATLVAIKDLEFQPDTIHIAANTTVYWINCEKDASVVHTVAAVDGTWRSSEMTRGQAYSRAFPAPVVPTPYYSIQHETTRGTILSN